MPAMPATIDDAQALLAGAATSPGAASPPSSSWR